MQMSIIKALYFLLIGALHTPNGNLPGLCVGEYQSAFWYHKKTPEGNSLNKEKRLIWFSFGLKWRHPIVLVSGRTADDNSRAGRTGSQEAERST